MTVFSPCTDMIIKLNLVLYETLQSVLSNDSYHISKLLFNFDVSLG